MIQCLLSQQAESSYGDIDGKVVADLGCGCGTLGIAALLLDAA
jgi:predicted RNA methylase